MTLDEFKGGIRALMIAIDRHLSQMGYKACVRTWNLQSRWVLNPTDMYFCSDGQTRVQAVKDDCGWTFQITDASQSAETFFHETGLLREQVEHLLWEAETMGDGWL